MRFLFTVKMEMIPRLLWKDPGLSVVKSCWSVVGGKLAGVDGAEWTGVGVGGNIVRPVLCEISRGQHLPSTAQVARQIHTNMWKVVVSRQDQLLNELLVKILSTL